ncbi:hypothetical protein AK812_SmicGene32552 [Symbiodinium microadriaticum]|uniref:BRCT domain-containing protein n=1 Tax=Symbiodinium microadriaticum TaxID=2951 RepID=A0A1Q9CTX6_SYMMI|nr:hypothetical protein AK812_SmicGene32552 [Symbiodinium microadriaticum]
MGDLTEILLGCSDFGRLLENFLQPTASLGQTRQQLSLIYPARWKFRPVQELLRQLDTINGTIRALDEAVHGRAFLKISAMLSPETRQCVQHPGEAEATKQDPCLAASLGKVAEALAMVLWQEDEMEVAQPEEPQDFRGPSGPAPSSGRRLANAEALFQVVPVASENLKAAKESCNEVPEPSPHRELEGKQSGSVQMNALKGIKEDGLDNSRADFEPVTLAQKREDSKMQTYAKRSMRVLPWDSFAHAQMLVWFLWLPADCSLQSCIALWDLAARGALLLLLHQLLGEGIFHFTQFSAPITPPRKGLSLAKGLCHMLRALFLAFGSAFAFPFALSMFRASPKMSRTPSVAQRNRPTRAFSMCRPSRSSFESGEAPCQALTNLAGKRIIDVTDFDVGPNPKRRREGEGAQSSEQKGQAGKPASGTCGSQRSSRLRKGSKPQKDPRRALLFSQRMSQLSQSLSQKLKASGRTPRRSIRVRKGGWILARGPQGSEPNPDKPEELAPLRGLPPLMSAPSAPERPDVLFTGFARSDLHSLRKMVNCLGGLAVNSLTGGGNGRTNVRVVVQCTSDAGKTVATKRSLKYMEGVLAGAWVLSSEWVHKSMHAGHWLPEVRFQLAGDLHALGGPARGRNHGPELFQGCRFHFVAIPPGKKDGRLWFAKIRKSGMEDVQENLCLSIGAEEEGPTVGQLCRLVRRAGAQVLETIQKVPDAEETGILSGGPCFATLLAWSSAIKPIIQLPESPFRFLYLREVAEAIFRAMCDEVGEQTDCHEHHERCSGFEKMHLDNSLETSNWQADRRDLMVQWEKQIEERSVPEWRDKYVAYARLKRKLEQIKAAASVCRTGSEDFIPHAITRAAMESDYDESRRVSKESDTEAPLLHREVIDSRKETCPEAKLVGFELNYSHARELDFADDWAFKADPGCQGPAVCTASVAPVINSTSQHFVLFQLFLAVASQQRTALHLQAAITIPTHFTRLRHLVGFLIPARRMQRLDAMGGIFEDFVLEGLMLLNVLVTTSAVYWLLRELYLLFCLPALDMHAVDVDEHLVIPAIDIMMEGMLDAICFVLGCMLLLLAASTFLKKFGSNDNPTDAIILTYPLLFGPPALLRIFLCICRRLLYHALFKHGVIIDFSKGVSQHDFLLSWSYLGFVVAVGILIFDAYIRVHEGQVTAKAMTINVIVFTSPLYYMISSLLNSLRVEQEAIKRTCLQQLEKTKGPDAPEEVSPSAKHKLCPLAEGSICRAARGRKDLNLSIKLAKEAPDRHDSDERFGLRDMFWVPRLVSGTGRSTCGALLLVTSMPVVAFLTMLLALVSHRFFILSTYSGFTLTSEADLERTTFLKNMVFDGSTEIADVAESVFVLRYRMSKPKLGVVEPQVQTYKITVIHVKPTFRTLMLRGIVDNGDEYTECVPGKNVGHSMLTIPDNLVSLRLAFVVQMKGRRVEAAFDQFYFGMPFTDARSDQITTIYMSNRDDHGSATLLQSLPINADFPAFWLSARFYVADNVVNGRSPVNQVGKWRCDGWCQRQLQCLGFQDSREGNLSA